MKCNRCGSKLVEKVNGKTKRTFIGCSNWPNCKGHQHYTYEDTYPIPGPDEMKEQAHREFDEWYERMKRLGMI